MYDLALNVKTWDLDIINGDAMLIDNAERVSQQIGITLRFWLGEWFLNTTDGMPYLEYILVKNPNMNHVRQVISDAIRSVEGVDRTDSLVLDYDSKNRQLYVTYEVHTTYGLVTRREVLGYGRH